MHVRVPATSANLGPGFDALGLALGLHDDVVGRGRPTTGCTSRSTGEGARASPRDETHLVVRAMRAAFDALGGQPPGLELRCANRIPHGRGLGSSAAAIVAGVLLARALVDGRRRSGCDDADVLALAAALEGHPDNVAACLLGGLTIAWTDDGARPRRAPRPRPGVVPGGARPAVRRVHRDGPRAAAGDRAARRRRLRRRAAPRCSSPR